MTPEQHIREDTLRALLRALPPTMMIGFGCLTDRGDATSFVREHIRSAAKEIGIDLGNTDADRKSTE